MGSLSVPGTRAASWGGQCLNISLAESKASGRLFPPHPPVLPGGAAGIQPGTFFEQSECLTLPQSVAWEGHGGKEGQGRQPVGSQLCEPLPLMMTAWPGTEGKTVPQECCCK